MSLGAGKILPEQELMRLRILVASPLGRVIEPVLKQAFAGSTVAVALDRHAVRREVVHQVRFDVVITDLIWNDPALEYSFDGLDVLDMLGSAQRHAAVLMAAQGHSMERDHLDEALLRASELAGFYSKSTGVPALLEAIPPAATGRRPQLEPPPATPPPLYQLFQGQRGETAARLAGAIAAGRATDAGSLARAARVGLNTANKVASVYIGPIVLERGEHDAELPLTANAIYRWCGVHAHYLLSWCRRNGHGDVLTSDPPAPSPRS
ncbi:response regulator [Nocardia sp. CA-119907]|uniref:response regulator n=1 Tax=Nocardia sp. CA-119907 TaxID=3239973 RepID=UPI003D96BC8D